MSGIRLTNRWTPAELLTTAGEEPRTRRGACGMRPPKQTIIYANIKKLTTQDTNNEPFICNFYATIVIKNEPLLGGTGVTMVTAVVLAGLLLPELVGDV